MSFRREPDGRTWLDSRAWEEETVVSVETLRAAAWWPGEWLQVHPDGELTICLANATARYRPAGPILDGRQKFVLVQGVVFHDEPVPEGATIPS